MEVRKKVLTIKKIYGIVFSGDSMLYSSFVKDIYGEYKNQVIEQRSICDVVSKFDYPRSFKMRKCANTVVYAVKDNSRKVVYGEYCDDRLCPICQSALHRERSSKLSFMVSECVKKGYTPYFWTFSPAPNCKLENLKECSRAVINVVNRVIKKFFNDENGVVGYWRTLEFTEHNEKKNKGKSKSYCEIITDSTSYHPHIHLLIMYKEKYKTANVYEISNFIKQEVEKQLKRNEKNKTDFNKFGFYSHLENTRGICFVKRVNTSNPGFAFELSKYISVSKKCNVNDLRVFSEQIQSLQCHRATGVLLWTDEYKEDYKTFIQNENYNVFGEDADYFVFTYRKDGFKIKKIEFFSAKDYIKEYERFLK